MNENYDFPNEARRNTAELGMLIFLASEIMFFGGLFLGYSIYRRLYPLAFMEGGRREDLLLGTVNTLVLITSSVFMAFSVDTVKNNQKRTTLILLAIVVLCGTIFLGIKAREYMMKFQESLYPGLPFLPGEHPARGMELFFSFYFAMTGLHAVHLFIGIGILVWLFVVIARSKEVQPVSLKLEIFGLYWHFVDIIWVFLFPLFYLNGRRM
jgi:cytochrome c oxidase subunit III